MDQVDSCQFLSQIVLPCRWSSFSLILVFSKNGGKSLSEKRTSTQGYAEQKHSGQSLPEEEQLSAILSMLFSQSAWVFGSLTDLYLQKSDLLNYMLLIRKFHL